MDDLTAIRSQPVPRDDALVRILGRRFVPIWGFIAYGVLYSFFLPPMALVAVALGMALLLGDREGKGRPMAAWRQDLMLAVAFLAALAAYAPFWLWARKRRSDAYRLFREGQLVEARVESAQLIVLRGAQVTRAMLRYADAAGAMRTTTASAPGQPVGLAVGETVPVLVHPASRYAAAFVDGRAVAAG
jgi:hypothetical protein